MPVQRAAEQCGWLKTMVDAGEIFHPLRWTPQQALQFLKDVSGARKRRRGRADAGKLAHESAGAPAGEGDGRRQARRRKLGLDALLDFPWRSRSTARRSPPPRSSTCLAQPTAWCFIRGKWVEIDRERLSRTLDQFEAIERRAAAEGLSFGEAMRLLAAPALPRRRRARADADWSQTVAGPWLPRRWPPLRHRTGACTPIPGRSLHGTLRPYQQAGVRWLHLLARLGLGACLADDMGLGKTIQVLSLLLVLKREADGQAQAVAAGGAGLAARQLGGGDRAVRAEPEGASSSIHRRCRPTGAKTDDAADLAGVDLVITSYGFLPRTPWLGDAVATWSVLDEAQAIKNPGARQTRTVKQLKADARIALTGTPIENRLGDLWSIFDFHQSRACSDRRSNSHASSSSSPNGRTTPTARCASWCAPTSCGA